MFSRALRIVTIAGIDVRLDPSLLVIVALVVWTFHGRFTAVHGGEVALWMAVAGALLFFGSVLAHELAHALEARHRGIEVSAITLFLFGGVTEMHAHGHRPRDELIIAAVGPWTSLVCGAAFGLVATSTGVLPAGLRAPVGDVAGLLGWLNVALAVFNLIPGAPLDGGRVLRAALWWVLGDRPRATIVTSRLGQLLGLAVVAFGAWILLRQPGAAVGAIWYLVIGVFLLAAASSELRQGLLDRRLSRHTVQQLLGARTAMVGAWTVGVGDVGLTVPVGTLPRVDADADLHALIDAFQGDHDVVAITRGGAVVAVATEREVAEALAAMRRETRARRRP